MINFHIIFRGKLIITTLGYYNKISKLYKLFKGNNIRLYYRDIYLNPNKEISYYFPDNNIVYINLYAIDMFCSENIHLIDEKEKKYLIIKDSNKRIEKMVIVMLIYFIFLLIISVLCEQS